MRLSAYDYRASGLYFVTICASQKRCVFSALKEETIRLTPLGKIIREVWFAIPRHFARVNLHSYMIMPNHFHGIIELSAKLPDQTLPMDKTQISLAQSVAAGSLSAVVRSFKAEVSRRARHDLNWQGRVWQPNYYDRVIRDGREFEHATRYILENPLMWEKDPEGLSESLTRMTKAKPAQHAARLQRFAPHRHF